MSVRGDELVAFLYSADQTRFSIALGASVKEAEHAKVPVLTQALHDEWSSTNADNVFSMALTWSLVFGCMLLKGNWQHDRIRSYLVEPHQFGVLREDVIELTDQEAFTHHYTMTKTDLETRLTGDPRKASILAQIHPGSISGEARLEFSGGLGRLLLGSAVGGVPGSLATPGSSSTVMGGLGGGGPSYNYAPVVEAELIDMCDLYVWNDKLEEYTIVTQAAPGVTIYDRKSSLLGHVKGLPPFTVIRPEMSLYDYFWGESFVSRLTWLQDWRSERINDIRAVLGRQVDPSWTITGGVGIAEEKLNALKARGGMANFPTPTATAKANTPELPNDVFAEIKQIDDMFDDTAGLGHVLQGKGEAGVRSRGQADLMARLGSARPKQRAIAAEESAEEFAGLMLRAVQDHSEQRFVTSEVKDPQGNDLTFTAEQFTRDYEVKVDAHSSSPIFVEDRKHDAVTLFENHCIDRTTMLEMFDPPNLQDLKERLKAMELREAEAKQMEMAAQHQHPTGKGARK